ncbi:MAG: L,D-transpeptidase family protein [Planctomycetes bacterium]|nr:L,D-transpeptidase family protein [Planctomycetota bacterium]
MATRKYKPYPTRKQQKSRRMRNVGLLLIGLIVAIVIFNRTYKNTPVEEQANESTVPYSDVLSSEVSEPTADSGPVTILNPAVASAEPTPKPQPVPTPQPEAISEPVEEVPVAPVLKPVVQPVVAEPLADTQNDKSSPHAKASVEEALKLRDAGKIIEARELLNDTLNEKLSLNLRSAVKFQMTKLAEQWLFSAKVFGGDKLTGSYQVQQGDHLERIAKKYKVPYEILMQINGIDRPELLRAGQHIKVIQGPFNVVIYKSNFTMDLYLQNKYIKTYRVGLGKVEYETPSGRWQIESGGKLIKPTWTDKDTGKTYVASDPDYPLGSRWIAIEGIDDATRPRTGFAIHGTKDPDSIGTRSSRGCIRLFNRDAVEVYNLLYGGISEVQIKD